MTTLEIDVVKIIYTSCTLSFCALKHHFNVPTFNLLELQVFIDLSLVWKIKAK